MTVTKEQATPAAQRAVLAKLQALHQECWNAGLPHTSTALQSAIEAIGWEMAGDKARAAKAAKGKR